MRSVSRTRAPMAPGRVPLLGHLPALHRDPLSFVHSLRSQGSLIRIRIGARTVHVVTSPDLVRTITVTEARSFDKGVMFEELRGHLGHGLVTSSGTFHHRQRRLVQPAFHHQRIAAHAGTMARLSAARAQSWVPQQPLDIAGELDALTLDILIRTLFHGERTPGVETAVRHWLSVKHQAMRRALSPLPPWTDRLRPHRGGHDAARLATLRLRRELGALIRDRRKQDGGAEDLLHMLLEARDPGTGETMSDAEVEDELLTLFVAGTGTLSAALAWTFHELAQHPGVRGRLHAEVDEVLAGRPAGAEDASKLPYTRAVLTEVLRLHPVWLLMRRTLTTVELEGVELPPGEEVFFSPHSLHQDPRWYPRPERFDPERWLPEGDTRPPRGAFVPFGAGNRLCIGEGFAWLEMLAILSAVVQRWQLVPSSARRVRPRVGTVVRPDRLVMVPVPR